MEIKNKCLLLYIFSYTMHVHQVESINKHSLTLIRLTGGQKGPHGISYILTF